MKTLNLIIRYGIPVIMIVSGFLTHDPAKSTISSIFILTGMILLFVAAIVREK